MISISGAECWQHDDGVIPLRDIGSSLGRIPRFAGHTQEWYPVLAHVLVAALMCEPKWSIYALFHDAPEALTNDVPTPWKTAEQREVEHALYERMCKAYGLPWPIPEEAQAAVDHVDQLCLVHEGYVLGHAAPDRLVRFDDRGLVKANSIVDDGVLEVVEYHLGLAVARYDGHPLPAFMNPAIAGPIYEDAFYSYLQKSIDAGLEGVDLEKARVPDVD